jgi:predicted nucleotide-binding protein
MGGDSSLERAKVGAQTAAYHRAALRTLAGVAILATSVRSLMSPSRTRPSAFVGSSSEGLPIAYTIQENLENDADVLVWTQDVFRPSEFLLESLLRQLDDADVGIFVFSADDTVRIRGEEFATARDNVVFEIGLFVGRLGRASTFIVIPRGDNLRLPSDLLGVTVLKYVTDRADGNLAAALGPVTTRIRTELERVVPKATTAGGELALPILERRALLSGRQRALLELVEANPGVTRGRLAEAFGIEPNEMHYRLEQLRLLTLVRAVRVVGEHGDDEPGYAPHPAYEAAKRSRSVQTLHSD